MIVQAAILYKNKVYIGKRHCDCIMVAHHATWDKPIIWVQWFIDDLWRFVNRKEAAVVALKEKQIEKLSYSKDELYSEDLY